MKISRRINLQPIPSQKSRSLIGQIDVQYVAYVGIIGLLILCLKVEEMSVALLNGADILVATPPCLLRLMDSCQAILNFRRYHS